MQRRRQALSGIVAQQHPMTVRQVFYAATVRGLIEKTEAGYAKIQTTLAAMRREGVLPYHWLADNTRWMRKPNSYEGANAFIRNTAQAYRKALWADADAYVEVWLEKDALAGVVVDVTAEFDVPLMVARGYASLSFLAAAAASLESEDRPCFIYHLGDHDPSGVNAGEKIEETLCELAPSADITFERIAVTPEQIAAWELPSRPTKTTDSRAKGWTGGDSVELDAIPPDMLRHLVRAAIERHMPSDELARLKRIESAERASILEFAAAWKERG
jgi:hypothetical protein